MDIDEDQVWNGVASAAAIGAVVVTKPVIEKLWRLVFRRDAPGNPAHEDVDWSEALLWALFAGALVGVIRLLAQRSAAAGWAKVRGARPPSLASTRP